jgi:Tfp pilus assembly protein PilF
MARIIFAMLLCSAAGLAQILDAAYAALAAKDYDRAILGFREAVLAEPSLAAIRKDLGYTLLKIGETVAAREQFAEALRLDPEDQHLALEYAFLCYETKEPVEARRVFARLGGLGNRTAAEAFENVDRPLRDGIARWQQALTQEPDNFSAHEELARLAEQRDELALAAEHYDRAWHLRPQRRDLLLDLGRVWNQSDRAEQAMAALLAASRGAEPRVAEAARVLLPDRYPYVYEFERALDLDPTNDELRRELAYLHLEMGNRGAADQQFAVLPERAPAPPDSPQPALLERPTPSPEARYMAERSLEKGYLLDAARYLRSAYESDPTDYGVILKLGQTYNMLQNDREAVRWFGLARSSPDAVTAKEATQAMAGLASGLRRVRTTVWAFPMISTRWRDTFAYAQAKVELRLPGIRPYLSLRFIGDVRGPIQSLVGLGPQYLSERSVILGAGLALPTWKGATLWFEAGRAVSYQGGATQSDLRGGLSFAKSVNRRRLFAETTDDALYVSRFNRDTIVYSQNRIGWTLSDSLQVYWNANATADVKREYWANTAETGPGVRWKHDGLQFSINFLRGAYLRNAGNPYRPNYNDVRIGVWYAFTH